MQNDNVQHIVHIYSWTNDELKKIHLACSSLAYISRGKKTIPPVKSLRYVLSRYGQEWRRQHVECIVAVISTTASCSIWHISLEGEKFWFCSTTHSARFFEEIYFFQKIYDFVVGGHHMGEKSLLDLGKQHYYFASLQTRCTWLQFKKTSILNDSLWFNNWWSIRDSYWCFKINYLYPLMKTYISWCVDILLICFVMSNRQAVIARKMICRFGTPRQLHADQGSNF